MGDYSNYTGAEWYLGEGEGEVLISNLTVVLCVKWQTLEMEKK